MSLNLAGGQDLWIVGGDLHDYTDAIFPKASITWGPQFALRHSEGKLYIKDLSSLATLNQTSLRLVKGEAAPLKTGDVISLANSVYYSIENLSGGSAKIKFLEEARPSTSAYDKIDSKEFPVTEAGAVIGKKTTHAVFLKHSMCSGAHATIYPDRIVDSSSNGTFLALRNSEEF